MAKYEMNLVAIGTKNEIDETTGKITKSQSASIYEDKDGHQHVVVRYMEVKEDEELKTPLAIADIVGDLKVLKFGVTPELTEEGEIKDEFLMAVPTAAQRVTYIKSRCVYSGETDAEEPKPLWTWYGAARYSVKAPAEKEGDEGHEVSPLAVAEPVVVKATRKKATVEETPVAETPAEETPAE